MVVGTLKISLDQLKKTTTTTTTKKKQRSFSTKSGVVSVAVSSVKCLLVSRSSRKATVAKTVWITQCFYMPNLYI